MGKIIIGVILIIGGLFFAAGVYSMRPPENLGEVFDMMIQGRDRYIKEPAYQIMLVGSLLVSALGAYLVFKGVRSR